VSALDEEATGETFGRHFTLERPGCQIHYWLAGAPDAPLVALSHAALTDHSFFAAQVPALVPRYRVLTWDIRRHGASRPLAGPCTIPDAVAGLAAILDSLRVSRAVMLGQSMGTYVGQEMTFRHPDRVSALIAIGGTGITADPGWLGRESLQATVPIMKAWPYANLKKQSVNASAVEESSREYLRQRFDELPRDEYLAIMDGVDRCIHPEPGYRTPGPTLLIVGQHDKTGTIGTSMAAWAQREPAGEHHRIEGAGHCANLDRPEQVTTLITGFLARHLDPRRKDVSRRCQAVWRLVFLQLARLAKEYREARCAGSRGRRAGRPASCGSAPRCRCAPPPEPVPAPAGRCWSSGGWQTPPRGSSNGSRRTRRPFPRTATACPASGCVPAPGWMSRRSCCSSTAAATSACRPRRCGR